MEALAQFSIPQKLPPKRSQDPSKIASCPVLSLHALSPNSCSQHFLNSQAAIVSLKEKQTAQIFIPARFASNWCYDSCCPSCQTVSQAMVKFGLWAGIPKANPLLWHVICHSEPSSPPLRHNPILLPKADMSWTLRLVFAEEKQAFVHLFSGFLCGSKCEA